MVRQNLPTSDVLALVYSKSAVLNLATAILILGSTMLGCTGVFFQPSRSRYPNLELEKLSAETVYLKSADGTKIAAWRIRSSKRQRPEPRGFTLQFHGNAENMTTHYQFQTWLLDEGWDVLTFDYRGYGESEGETSNLDGVLADGVAALKWADELSLETTRPLVIFGQSLGASIAVSALAEYHPQNFKLLVIDSGFYSFTSIAQEKLSESWFLWPVQWLGHVLVSDELSAAPRLKLAKPVFKTPAIFLHSENDPVVSNRQGEKIFAAYPGPKVRWTTKEPGHVNTLFADVSNAPPWTSMSREKLKSRLREIEVQDTRVEKRPTSK